MRCEDATNMSEFVISEWWLGECEWENATLSAYAHRGLNGLSLGFTLSRAEEACRL